MNFLIDPWEVCYHIYPLSFFDNNNDGYGDLPGVIKKLSYLKQLGIDRFWISSHWKTGMVDNGYDITDYLQVNKHLGTLSDFKKLISLAHNQNLKVIVDVVFNHTSDEHNWFTLSKTNREPYNNFYFWTDNPNYNLKNNINALSYTYDNNRKLYYLHLFGSKQIDLNWNSNSLRNEFVNILQQYLKWKVDGFRFDVIDMIGKVPQKDIVVNGPYLHQYLQELASKTYGHKNNFLSVGECWSAGLKEIIQYTSKEKFELSHVFALHLFTKDFSHKFGQWKLNPFNFLDFKNTLTRYQNFTNKEAIVNVLSNHDIPRFSSRVFKQDAIKYNKEISKMLMAFLLTLNGIPFIFQGEEIGMTGIESYSDFHFNDYETLARIKMAKKNPNLFSLNDIYRGSRDNSRTMMQWDSLQIHQKTWIAVNENVREINVNQQMLDPNSVLNNTKTLIALRHSVKYRMLFSYAHFELIPFENEKIIAYYKIDNVNKQKLLVITNFSTESQILKFKYHKIILSNNFNQSKNLLIAYGFLIAEV